MVINKLVFHLLWKLFFFARLVCTFLATVLRQHWASILISRIFGKSFPNRLERLYFLQLHNLFLFLIRNFFIHLSATFRREGANFTIFRSKILRRVLQKSVWLVYVFQKFLHDNTVFRPVEVIKTANRRWIFVFNFVACTDRLTSVCTNSILSDIHEGEDLVADDDDDNYMYRYTIFWTRRTTNIRVQQNRRYHVFVRSWLR